MVDQDLLVRMGGYRRRRAIVALLLVPGVRAGFVLRLATSGYSRLVSTLARNAFVSWFGGDVSPTATIRGALHLPHPVGIVIGQGVIIEDGVNIYQNVTLGAGRGGYPVIGAGATILPAAIVVGSVRVGAGARIAAASFVEQDVAPGATHYR